MKNKLTKSLLILASISVLGGCNKNVDKSVFVLAENSLTLNVDDDYKLNYTIENVKGSVKWSSSDPSVVSVSSNFLLAKNVGEAVITAKAGDITRTCTVSVTDENSGQFFVDTSKAFNVDINNAEGFTPEFHYFVIRNNTKTEIFDEQPTIEIKDNAIAKFENGKIIPISVGQTTLKVDYKNASGEYILNVCTNVISTYTQFFNMINNRDDGSFYALANDIDLTGKTFDVYSKSNDLTDYAKCFKGTFEGNGYTVKGIKIVGKNSNNSIFGSLYNAHIKDVNFEDVTLENNGAESIAVLANGITGDDCEIQNVKISCNIKGRTTGNINLITSKYLENSYRLYKSATEWDQVSNGPSKITNVLIDAKFDGKTMSEANCNILPADSLNFLPECKNVFIYAPGGYTTTIPGVNVYKSKLDLIWDVHNSKALPDTNWDYSDQFDFPKLLNASSKSGYIYAQGDMQQIDSNYEIIKDKITGKEIFPYGNHIEGFVYGDHPTEKSKKAVFVNQRLSAYASALTVPAADVDLDLYNKVCFFVRTKTFNKSFITIKDLNTNRDYSTLLYDCEVSNKWVKVEIIKKSQGLYNVYIGKDKIGYDYPASYFKDIPLRFNDTRYYYSEMFGIRDPNVTEKNWVSTGAAATKTNSSALATTNAVLFGQLPSSFSSIVEGSGLSDLATLSAQNISESKQFKFYVRGSSDDKNYFIITYEGDQTVAGVPGLVSFQATTTNWTCFSFVVSNDRISVRRNDVEMAELDTTDFTKFGIQLSGGKFYISEMYAYK